MIKFIQRLSPGQIDKGIQVQDGIAALIKATQNTKTPVFLGIFDSPFEHAELVLARKNLNKIGHGDDS